jgi:hypothetical protein
MVEINSYYSFKINSDDTQADNHRCAVGGLWDKIGNLTFNFLRHQAQMTTEMKVLDLGCGCFRCGHKIINYLESGNYYGIDLIADLVDAGFEELRNVNLENKLPRNNIYINDDFNASIFGVEFDIVLAQSLWTHLPLNHIQSSLAAVEKVLSPNGALYATVFLCPDNQNLLDPCTHEPGGIVSYRDRDPYHYRPTDFRYLTKQLNLNLELLVIGGWNHPRNQQMLRFTKK